VTPAYRQSTGRQATGDAPATAGQAMKYSSS